ncbi:ElyC/SanA/YdcF family protein [Streptomyces sp. DT193]|uniref:ElyC/SanA/YdcF family protein n=1 Tax=Streptomyces sp. DT193 TaxID=3393418 RepID=UPI003CF117BE
MRMTRWRSSGTLARPAMIRFWSFRSVMRPSLTPELNGVVMPWTTADWWALSPMTTQGNNFHVWCMMLSSWPQTRHLGETVTEPVATDLIVFGRGLEHTDDSFQLTEAGRLRVETAVAYLRAHAQVFRQRHGKIIFSGGWAGAAEGMAPPPVAFREGILMLRLARSLTESEESVELLAETESDSTLENVLRVHELGFFDGVEFGTERPLGLVAHEGHLQRAEYFTRKVFGLPQEHLRLIPAGGADYCAHGLSERQSLAVSRIACFGARTPGSLRTRHHLMTSAARRIGVSQAAGRHTVA